VTFNIYLLPSIWRF